MSLTTLKPINLAAESGDLVLIRNHAFFADITGDEFEEMGLHHRYKEAYPGEYIYFDAQEHNNLYFLKEGFVKIGYINGFGEEVIKEIIAPGDVFGQIMLEPNNLNGEFAQAYKSQVSLCMFRVADFEKLIKVKPGLALRYARQVGEKLNRIENKLVNLLHSDVKHRILLFLDDLAKQGDVQPDGSVIIPVPITHADIAALIASTRQTVTVLLGEFQKEGIIDFVKRRLVLKNPGRVKKALAAA